MLQPKTGTTQCHAQLGLPDKGRAIKGLVVWDLELLSGLLEELALCCYQTGATHYHTQLGLPDNDLQLKGQFSAMQNGQDL